MPHLTTTDGVRVSYETTGTGRDIVFVAGIGCPGRWWAPQVEALSAHARITTYDLRGTGASDRTQRGARISRYAADLHELLVEEDLTDVVLVGWSLGVSVALGYLDLFGSDRVGDLVLVEGSPKLISDADWTLGFIDLPGAVGFVEALPSAHDATMRGLVESMFVDPGSEPDLLTLQDAAADTGADHIGPLLWNHLTQDWRDVLPGITVPTTVVAGEKSAIISSDASRFVAEQVPGARLELFAAAGHALFREETDRFNDLVRGIAAG